MKGDLVFAVPGDLFIPTGGYAYDRRVIEELKLLGWRVQVVDLGDGFPRPTKQTSHAAAEKLESLSAGLPIVVDGLAFGVMPETAARLRSRHPLIALVHHPLALESGLSAAENDMFRRSERTALAAAHRIIATSAATARLLASDYDVPTHRIVIARPGSDPAAPAHVSADGTVRLLAVGGIVPRKGYDVLIAALATLTDLSWQLTIAGAHDRNADAAAQLQKNICRLGLSERVHVAGAVTGDNLAKLYQTSDVFVLASRFEGYGMAYAEAIAHGLPVVGTTAGAIPETVPAAAGVLVPPDDVDALARALRQLLERPQERQRLAAGARAAARDLPTWRETAKCFSRAVETAR